MSMRFEQVDREVRRKDCGALERMMSVHEEVNILMVDDQAGKLLTYEAILADLGENLIKATSAKEALEKLLKTDVAVVLMDVSMPEIDGFELAEIIRQHPRFQKTAIIFISAVHLTDLDRLKGYQHGAVDYLSVPIVPEVLRAKVRVFAELHRKKLQLERLNNELEVRVADRTLELEQKALALQTTQQRPGPEEPGTGRHCAYRSRYYFQPAGGWHAETTSAADFTNTRVLPRVPRSDLAGWSICIPMTKNEAWRSGCDACSRVKPMSPNTVSAAPTSNTAGSALAPFLFEIRTEYPEVVWDLLRHP